MVTGLADAVGGNRATDLAPRVPPAVEEDGEDEERQALGGHLGLARVFFCIGRDSAWAIAGDVRPIASARTTACPFLLSFFGEAFGGGNCTTARVGRTPISRPPFADLDKTLRRFELGSPPWFQGP